MSQPQHALFQLAHYKIVDFSFINPGEEAMEVSINFEPEGTFEKSKLLYTLSLTVEVCDTSDKAFLKIKTIALFKFLEGVQEIPDYFYPNSVGIIFPYIRAFINVMTSIANIKPLMLPLLNVTMLGDGLKESTTVKE